MNGQTQDGQVLGQKDLELVRMLKYLDGGGELDREGLRRLVELIDAVDEAYASGSVDNVRVESSTEFKLFVGRMTGRYLWFVSTGEDDSWYRVGEVLVGDDVLLARNFSEKPMTRKTILVEDSEAAEAFAKVLGLSGDVEYDCVDFWVDKVKTEAFKCFNDNTVMYLVIAPEIVYVALGKSGKFVTVRNRDAVKAFHVLLNVPL